MDQENAKGKIKDVLENSKASVLSAMASGKGKFDAAGGLDGIKAKALVLLKEVQNNFKADEGAQGGRKVQSMFVNLWKSGTVGKSVLATGFAVVLLLLLMVCTGGEKSTAKPDAAFAGTPSASASGKSVKPAPAGALVIKGLWVGMSGDDALTALKGIVGDSKELVAMDFRNGLEIEKSEEVKAQERETWENEIRHSKYDEYEHKRAEMSAKGKSDSEIDAAYPSITFEEFVEKHPIPDYEACAKEEYVQKRLEKVSLESTPPSPKQVLPKQNLVKIALRDDSKDVEKWQYECNCWLDDKGNVDSMFFSEDAIERLFKSGDLSSKEFAALLVKNYAAIPSLKESVNVEMRTPNLVAGLKTYTWAYKDPKGFQVELVDRNFFDEAGRKVEVRPDWAINIVQKTNKYVEKYLSISAIRSEASRKLD